MTRRFQRGCFPNWTVSAGDFPFSDLAPARGLSLAHKTFGSDHPKNLVLRGTSVGLDSGLWFSGGEQPACQRRKG